MFSGSCTVMSGAGRGRQGGGGGGRGERGQGGERETGGERERGMNTIKFSAQKSATHCSCGIRSTDLLLVSPIISVCDYVSGPEGGREGGKEGGRERGRGGERGREGGRNTIAIVLYN